MCGLVGVAVAVCVSTSPQPARAHVERAGQRAALPSVLRLVDESRKIRLPGGRRVARPETAFATAYEGRWHDRRVRAALILSGAELGRHVRIVSHTAPLLAIQGTADRINPPVYSLDLFRAVGRPKFLLLLRHASHLGP